MNTTHQTLEQNMNDFFKEFTVKIKIKGLKRAKVRFAIAKVLLKIVNFILPCKMDIKYN